MARTKAEKLRSKRESRGRPPMPANDREPNGKLSRRHASIQKRTEENIMNVAISRRVRHLGLVDTKEETAAKQAIDPKRGYALGLMLLDGTITDRQHEAGQRFAQDMARYYGLTGVQFPSARARDLFSVRGDGDEATSKISAAANARAQMNRLRDVCLGTGDINTGRRIYHTVVCVTVQDIPESRNWPNHMMLWLKRGLNKLADYYGLPEEED